MEADHKGQKVARSPSRKASRGGRAVLMQHLLLKPNQNEPSPAPAGVKHTQEVSGEMSMSVSTQTAVPGTPRQVKGTNPLQWSKICI